LARTVADELGSVCATLIGTISETPMKRQAPSAAGVAEKPTQAKVRAERKVPVLSGARLALHEGITANRERFSLKASAERVKKPTGK